MKKLYKILLILTLLFNATAGFSTSHTITNSGSTFVPDSISATVGDTIIFSLTTNHNAIEVYDTSWALNHRTSNGGFQTPLGGGIVVVTQAKIYYYVCGIHFASGMKGRIFVQSASGIETVSKAATQFDIGPNPARENFMVRIQSKTDAGKLKLEVYDLLGKMVFTETLQNDFESISCDRFLRGTYLVKITDTDDSRVLGVRKIVIE